jgi:hypothetical protein
VPFSIDVVHPPDKSLTAAAPEWRERDVREAYTPMQKAKLLKDRDARSFVSGDSGAQPLAAISRPT